MDGTDAVLPMMTEGEEEAIQPKWRSGRSIWQVAGNTVAW